MPKSETYESAESVTTALETEDSSLSNFAFGTEQRQELWMTQAHQEEQWLERGRFSRGWDEAPAPSPAADPILEAASENRAEVIISWLKDPSHSEYACTAVLSTALKHRHMDIVTLCVKDQRADPNIVVGSRNPTTALIAGVENDIPEIVDALLKNPRTDVNWRIPKGPRESYTAFHTAIELPSRWKILWMLMKFHRVDVNAKTNMGVTPLMLICHVGNMLALRKLLADRRVELSIRDDSGRTAFDYYFACGKICSTDVDLFLEHEQNRVDSARECCNLLKNNFTEDVTQLFDTHLMPFVESDILTPCAELVCSVTQYDQGGAKASRRWARTHKEPKFDPIYPTIRTRLKEFTEKYATQEAKAAFAKEFGSDPLSQQFYPFNCTIEHNYH